MDWSVAHDARDGRHWDLSDPFAAEYAVSEREAAGEEGGHSEHVLSRFLPRTRQARERAAREAARAHGRLPATE